MTHDSSQGVASKYCGNPINKRHKARNILFSTAACFKPHTYHRTAQDAVKILHTLANALGSRAVTLMCKYCKGEFLYVIQ
jgi:hypothetical protein